VGRICEAIDRARAERGAAVMGVLNVTPDSFYDGGRYLSAAASAARLAQIRAEGADIVDIGAESSRPGAEEVSAREQLARLEPALRTAVAQGAPYISVDTTSPEVASQALQWGAHAINDVSCLADPDLARVAARHDAALIIMHSRGRLGSMAGFSQYPQDAYHDVVEDILMEWQLARDRAIQAGMSRDSILLDPGLGFAKNAQHSLEVVQRFAEFASSGARLVVGPGRKSFIGAIDSSSPEQRLGGTIATSLLCMQRGASVLRVHDVAVVRQALIVAAAAHGGAA
jgi:dihydropteroate synthase